MLSWLWSFVSTTNKNNKITEDTPLLSSPFVVPTSNDVSKEVNEEISKEQIINNREVKPKFNDDWEEVHYVRQNLRRVNSIVK